MPYHPPAPTSTGQQRNRRMPADLDSIFPGSDAECQVNCNSLLELIDQYEEEKDPRVRQHIAALIRALERQAQALHCRPCLPM